MKAVNDELAEKIMGWKTWVADGTREECWATGDARRPTIRKSGWNPIEDIRDAWAVLEKLKGQSVVLNYGEDTQGWECSFIVGGKRFTSVRSEPTHAICYAALYVVNEHWVARVS